MSVYDAPTGDRQKVVAQWKKQWTSAYEVGDAATLRRLAMCLYQDVNRVQKELQERHMEFMNSADDATFIDECAAQGENSSLKVRTECALGLHDSICCHC
jgi:hypothetical protein